MPDKERTYQHPEDKKAVERFDYEGGALQRTNISEEEENTDTSQNAPSEKKKVHKNR